MGSAAARRPHLSPVSAATTSASPAPARGLHPPRPPGPRPGAGWAAASAPSAPEPLGSIETAVSVAASDTPASSANTSARDASRCAHSAPTHAVSAWPAAAFAASRAVIAPTALACLPARAAAPTRRPRASPEPSPAARAPPAAPRGTPRRLKGCGSPGPPVPMTPAAGSGWGGSAGLAPPSGGLFSAQHGLTPGGGASSGVWAFARPRRAAPPSGPRPAPPGACRRALVAVCWPTCRAAAASRATPPLRTA
jgi:hypothetical protein